MLADLRYAFRQLTKAPGFTATVVLTLALGIGACTVVLSVASSVVLGRGQHLDFSRMVRITESPPANVPEPDPRASVANFLHWRAQAKSFDGMIKFWGGRFNFTGGTEPLPLIGRFVTEDAGRYPSFAPRLGRAFRPEEFVQGRNLVTIISHSLWLSLFAGDPKVIGRTISLNEQAHTVIGVMGDGNLRWSPDVWVPGLLTEAQRVDRKNRTAVIIGILKPGVTIAQAQAELDLIAAQLAQQYPDTNQGWSIRVASEREVILGSTRTGMWTLLAAVGCVLLMACANIANLLLARATARQREMSVRAAVGASRGRLVRLLLIESLLLGLIGGAAGVWLSVWGLETLQTLMPDQTPLLTREYRLDTGMLAFALALSLTTGIVFGLVPSWLASRVDLNSALRQGARGSTEGGTRGRWRRALVALQVACAVVLLAGAGLLVRSFLRLAQVDPGFATTQTIALEVFPRGQRYAGREARDAFAEAVLARLRTVPGVEAAGATLQLPLRASTPSIVGFEIAGQPTTPREQWPTTVYYTASPDYFRAAGTRLLRGRAFSAIDSAQAPRVVIINETMAKRFFAGVEPVGQHLQLATADSGWREIVGVVADVKQHGLGQPSLCQVYEPNAQGQYPGSSFVVRCVGDLAALIPLLKQQVYAVDQYLPVQRAMPLESLFDQDIAVPRFLTQILVVFSGIALLIAMVGIYGVMAYSVSQRTTEIGIRMALGATASSVVRQVLAQGMKPVVAGLALGLSAALALAQIVQALLFNTSPHDPLTLVTIMSAIILVSLLACWLPARRATKVDPMTALRAE